MRIISIYHQKQITIMKLQEPSKDVDDELVRKINIKINGDVPTQATSSESAVPNSANATEASSLTSAVASASTIANNETTSAADSETSNANASGNDSSASMSTDQAADNGDEDKKGSDSQRMDVE